MKRFLLPVIAVLLLVPLLPGPVEGQEARRRWERMAEIRRDKFDLVLPRAMRENDIDMWIVTRREGYDDPLTPDLGGGYVSDVGYYVFTDRGGERIERAALGISGPSWRKAGATTSSPATSTSPASWPSATRSGSA